VVSMLRKVKSALKFIANVLTFGYLERKRQKKIKEQQIKEALEKLQYLEQQIKEYENKIKNLQLNYELVKEERDKYKRMLEIERKNKEALYELMEAIKQHDIEEEPRNYDVVVYVTAYSGGRNSEIIEEEVILTKDEYEILESLKTQEEVYYFFKDKIGTKLPLKVEDENGNVIWSS